MAVSSVGSSGAELAGRSQLSRSRQAEQAAQRRIATGSRVPGADVDGAAFAVGQGIQGDIGGLGAVNQQLGQARGVTGTALQAATSISDTLTQARTTLVKLADGNLSADQRAQYSADLQRLGGEIGTFIENGGSNGRNLVQAGPNGSTVGDAEGGQITLTNAGLTAAAASTALGGGGTIGAGQAASLLQNGGGLDQISQQVGDALVNIAGDQRRIDNQRQFNSALSDANTAAAGAVADADLAREATAAAGDSVRSQLGIAVQAAATRRRGNIVDLFV
ncbi:MAG: flagellin [Rhodospirillales bacterium]